jgi:AcrR family transcriptional regulator
LIKRRSSSTRAEPSPAGRVRTPSYRSVHARRAILVAARQLLRSRGYANTTMEAVAAKSGVSKVTIYRRWPSKGALALEVLLEFQDFGPAPDTGTTRGDLIAIVRGVNTGLAHPTATAVIPGLATDLARDPTLAKAFRERFALPRRRSVAEAIERGIERGDLPTEVDEDLLIDLLSSPFFYRIFITGHRVEPDLAEKLVDFVLLRHIPKKAATPL